MTDEVTSFLPCRKLGLDLKSRLGTSQITHISIVFINRDKEVAFWTISIGLLNIILRFANYKSIYVSFCCRKLNASHMIFVN